MKNKSAQFIFICLLTVFSVAKLSAQAISWKEAKQQQKAELDLYWFLTKPFIYKEKGKLPIGLEVEILEHFQSYVKGKHNTDLSLNWIEANDFNSIVNIISSSPKSNSFGVSAFSITDLRKKSVQFTDPYLSDLVVLVSSKGSKIVKTLDEINEMMDNMTAVTIKGTIYEQFLLDLRKQLNLTFEITYIEHDENILDEIRTNENKFGFIDLPIYLMLIESGGVVTRQNFFTVKGSGYALMMPKNSDWVDIFNEFLADPEIKKELDRINSKYLGADLYRFIEGLQNEDDLGFSILTKEKEIQLKVLQNTNILLQKEKDIQFTYTIIAIVATFLLIIIVVLFYKTLKSTKVLRTKNNQIKEQQKSIKLKNEQLNNRNSQLTSLNEEKNNLVRILAHDMRSPINHISGLVNILRLTHKDYSEEDKAIINQIEDAVKRLNQMISKILDFDELGDGNEMKINPEEIKIIELFKEIENQLSGKAKEKNIRVLMEAENDLHLSTDHLLFSQILENLINNAIKFSPVDKTVLVKAEDEGDSILFSVKDEGPGLTENDKTLVYKKFQKLSARPTKGEDSIGLGLSIVKKFTELLGGSAWVESKKGEGANFKVRLPKEATYEQ